MLAIDLVLAPDGHVPGAQVHPAQEERFEVVSGTMKFRLGGKKIIARAGDVVVVPAGSVHRFANAGEEPACVRVEVRPALKMEHLFETTVALAREGRTNRRGMPKPLDLALFVREYDDEVRAPFPPAPVVKAATAPLAWIASIGVSPSSTWPRAYAPRRRVDVDTAHTQTLIKISRKEPPCKRSPQ